MKEKNTMKMVRRLEANKKIEKFIIYAVEVIFILILSFFTIESIFKTCSISTNEVTTYLYDNPFIHISTISLTILLFTCINSNKIKIDKKILLILIGVWTLISVIWIYISDLYPRADQKYIYNIAAQMREGIFNAFEIGGYAFSNPHQAGLLLYEYILGFIFKSKNYLGLQLINLVALLVIYFSIYKITRIMFKDKKTSISTIFGLFLFIPMWFYITFIYGNIIGLMFSMVSTFFVLKYLENDKIKDLLISAICMSLAVAFKSNYLIMLIAIICIILLDTISNKKAKNLIVIMVFLIMYIIVKTAIPLTLQVITGREKTQGIPMIAYVEMGLQEGARAPGWYNAYNRNVFRKNKYNSEETSKNVKNDIKASINKLKSDPKYTIEFFYKKTVSQWNNSTFQCFWIGRSRKTGTGKEKSTIVKSINGNGKINKILTEYTNIIQTIILFGATSFMIINFKKINGKQLIFAVMFIGGFLFHMLWEAKCQYTISYFILLIPYSMRGYLQLSKIVQKFINNSYKKLIKQEYLEKKQ